MNSKDFDLIFSDGSLKVYENDEIRKYYKFLEALQRRDDTFYVVSFKRVSAIPLIFLFIITWYGVMAIFLGLYSAAGIGSQ